MRNDYKVCTCADSVYQAVLPLNSLGMRLGWFYTILLAASLGEQEGSPYRCCVSIVL